MNGGWIGRRPHSAYCVPYCNNITCWNIIYTFALIALVVRRCKAFLSASEKEYFVPRHTWTKATANGRLICFTIQNGGLLHDQNILHIAVHNPANQSLRYVFIFSIFADTPVILHFITNTLLQFALEWSEIPAPGPLANVLASRDRSADRAITVFKHLPAFFFDQNCTDIIQQYISYL